MFLSLKSKAYLLVWAAISCHGQGASKGRKAQICPNQNFESDSLRPLRIKNVIFFHWARQRPIAAILNSLSEVPKDPGLPHTMRESILRLVPLLISSISRSNWKVFSLGVFMIELLVECELNVVDLKEDVICEPWLKNRTLVVWWCLGMLWCSSVKFP